MHHPLPHMFYVTRHCHLVHQHTPAWQTGKPFINSRRVAFVWNSWLWLQFAFDFERDRLCSQHCSCYHWYGWLRTSMVAWGLRCRRIEQWDDGFWKESGGMALDAARSAWVIKMMPWQIFQEELDTVHSLSMCHILIVSTGLLKSKLKCFGVPWRSFQYNLFVERSHGESSKKIQFLGKKLRCPMYHDKWGSKVSRKSLYLNCESLAEISIACWTKETRQGNVIGW
jgi:hypothetical protein